MILTSILLQYFLHIYFLNLFGSEESQNTYKEYRGAVKNQYVPVSQNILVCAVHPLNETIIAGTKVGFHDMKSS